MRFVSTLFLALGAVHADWVNDLRLSLANQALDTTKSLRVGGFTNSELRAFALKHDGQNAQVSKRMSERSFLAKWSDVVTTVNFNKQVNSSKYTDGEDPFDLLIDAINKITGAWSGIVSAFKSEYEEQLLESHLQNGWSEFKQATKVFKGAGLDYSKTDDFFSDIRSMIGIPDKYASDFDKQIEWIKFFDNVTWSEHNTQFQSGKGGDDTTFSMYARNSADDNKIDDLFLTCSEEFKLAPDYFVISEHRSILGGLFDHTEIKFKEKPASITDQDLTFVSEFFSLLAYQQIALAEDLPSPPDPSFPSS